MISVCIATYNGERYLKEQLDSILAQISDEDEVIVSDDGSSDRTLDIVRAYRKPNIRICVNEGNHGYTPNFENALKNAKGDYIFLSDQDDVWKQNKVAVCMEILRTYDFVVSDAEMVDGDGKLLYGSFFKERGTRHGLLSNIIMFGYLGCCLCFRRELLQFALPFPADHKLCTHDNWLTLTAFSFMKVKVTDEKLISYRRYGSNASTGGLKDTTGLWFKLHYRIYLLVHIFGRLHRLFTREKDI